MIEQKLSEQKIKSCFNNKSCEDVAKHIKCCLIFLLEQKDLKPADVFNHISIHAYDDSCENNDLYFSFIVSISFAVLNVSPFTKYMEDSLDEVIALVSDSSLAFYFHVVTLNMIFGENDSNEIKEENLKTLLLKTLVEVHDDVNLKNYYSDNKLHLNVNILGLKKVRTQLKIIKSFKESLFEEKSEITQKIVHYVNNLYKDFKLKTVVEFKKEEKVFKILLEVHQLVFQIFKSNRADIVANIIKHWPTCYKYQLPVIELF